MITRMGPEITVAKVISTFESVYDYVDTKESVLGKFLTANNEIMKTSLTLQEG